MEQELLNPGALSAQRAPTDDQKLITLLRDKLQSYEKEVDGSIANVNWLKENQLLEQGHIEKAEMELSNLQDIEAKPHNVELELASCRVLLSNKLSISSYGNISPRQTATNLNDAGEVTSRRKELEVGVESADLNVTAENGTREVKRLELMLAAVTDERDRLRKERAILSKQNPALKLANSYAYLNPLNLVSLCSYLLFSQNIFIWKMQDMLSALSGMEKIVRELESTIDELNEMMRHQHAKSIRVNERLSIEVGKVKSLEQQGEQLHLQVASLESKVGPPDYTTSSTEVLHTSNSLSVSHVEATQTVETLQSESKKTRERLQEVEGLKVQAGPVKKQQDAIEISDDENTSPWNDNGNKRSLKSDPTCSGKLVPGFVKEKHVIEIDDDEYCMWSDDDRKCSPKSDPSCSGETGFVKKEPFVIEINDDEDTSMWRFDDKKRSQKSNPSLSGRPDVEAVLDCCGRRPWGTAPCFTCSRHPGR